MLLSHSSTEDLTRRDSIEVSTPLYKEHALVRFSPNNAKLCTLGIEGELNVCEVDYHLFLLLQNDPLAFKPLGTFSCRASSILL